MVLKSHDFASYNERVKTDLQSLKSSHELGISEAGQSGDQIGFTEDLTREELLLKMYNSRNLVIDSIKRCDSAEINDITQGFLAEVNKIDILKPAAVDEVHDLAQRIDLMEQCLPLSYSLYHPTTVSILMFIPLKLNDLETLCRLYQKWFGNR